MAKNMADDAGTTKAGSNKMTKILLILGGVNTLALLGLGGYLLFGKSNAPASLPPASAADGASGPAATGDEPGPIFEMLPLVVNLNEPSGDRYLRVRAELEVSSEDVLKEVESRQSQLRDQILGYLSSLRFTQTQGIEGKEKIRQAIINRINAYLRTGRVVGVYFTEFVVQ